MATDEHKIPQKLWLGYVALLGLLLLLDPQLLDLVGLLPHDEAHAVERAKHFTVVGWPGFFAVFGFVGAWLTVMVTKLIVGKLLARPDTYYADDPLVESARGIQERSRVDGR